MITLRLMGGLGNQMFQYAVIRSLMEEYKEQGQISLKGITNKTHNVFFLNHLNINKDIKIIKKENLKSKITYLIYGFYCVFLVKKENGYEIMKKIQPFLNKLGIYCVPDGFIELNNSKRKNKNVVGYFQSVKYFDKYKDIIKKELKVKTKLLSKNKDLLKEIQNNNSVCVHIRRGDYIGSNHQVCDINYYLKALKIMNQKIKNAKYYIFSDDIDWVKENIDFGKNATFVSDNPNYEDLRLMYSCKNFIISNSSFSWWAQYLSDNDKKITIAPSRWFQNKKQHSDIYQEDWILIEV